MLPPEGAFSQASMSAMTKSAQNLSAAASSGGFAISAEGAAAYVQALQQAMDELDMAERETVYLRQETKLGTSPDGQAMSRYNLEGAMGGAGTTGILPAIAQLRTALSDAKSAMEKAVQNYKNVDDNASSSYKRY